MGAWGHEIFDNDASCDSVHRYLDAKTADEFYGLINKSLDEMFKMDYLEVDEAGEITIIAYLVGRLNGDELEFANVNDYWKDKIAPVIAANQPQYKKWLLDTKFEGASVDARILNIFERVLLNGEVSEAYELWGETEYFQPWLDYSNQFVSYYQNRNHTP